MSKSPKNKKNTEIAELSDLRLTKFQSIFDRREKKATSLNARSWHIIISVSKPRSAHTTTIADNDVAYFILISWDHVRVVCLFARVLLFMMNERCYEKETRQKNKKKRQQLNITEQNMYIERVCCKSHGHTAQSVHDGDMIKP